MNVNNIECGLKVKTSFVKLPMPQQHGAVLWTGRDVTVGGDVALGATHACHYAVVTEYYLNYFSCKHKITIQLVQSYNLSHYESQIIF